MGIAVRWEWIAVGYSSYLLVVALLGRRFARARIPVLVAALVCPVVLAIPWLAPPGVLLDETISLVLVPAAMLLAGYWLSGLFVVTPMQRAERALMAVDDRYLRRLLAAYDDGPQAVREAFELAYVLVYLVVPAGVAALAIGGHADVIPRFWAVVLLAEFVCYGTMPWVQTRPPRVLEAARGGSSSMVRRLNLAVLDRGSIQANTVPSGHAAGAVATALAVSSAMPVAGLVLLIVAACIVAATVLGRYHYLVDSLLGILVAIAAWCALM